MSKLNKKQICVFMEKKLFDRIEKYATKKQWSKSRAAKNLILLGFEKECEK